MVRLESDAEPTSLRAGTLRTYELDGEATIFDPRSGAAIILNVTASEMWRRLDGLLPTDALVDGIAEDYLVSPQAVAHDVVALLDQLDELGLLVDREPPRRRGR